MEASQYEAKGLLVLLFSTAVAFDAVRPSQPPHFLWCRELISFFFVKRGCAQSCQQHLDLMWQESDYSLSRR